MTGVTLPAQIDAGVLDAELGGLLWLLVGAGVPLNVTGPPGSGRRALRTAVLALAAGSAAGGEAPGKAAGEAGSAGDDEAGIGSAASLEELLASGADEGGALGGHAVEYEGVPDRHRGLGLVVVMGRAGADARLLAAHYVRPVERDREGHLQRRPPALLSARDAATDRLEHFHWAIAPELADRASLTVAQFEQRRLERVAFLADLASAGILEEPAVARALRGFALNDAPGSHERH